MKWQWPQKDEHEGGCDHRGRMNEKEKKKKEMSELKT